MELVEGVHALGIDYEYDHREMTLHLAAVETPRGTILVDTGLPGSTEKVADALDDAGLDLGEVAFVLLTHHDGDHVGSCRDLLVETDATTLAHREAVPYVTGERAPIKGDADDRPPAVPVDVELTGGVRFRTIAGPMEVLHTPGHAPGHVSLYFPDRRLLVSGDALTAEGGDLSGPKVEFTPDIDTAAESVGRLASLDVESVLCYHGGYVEEGTERLEAIHAELQELE